MRIAFFFLFCLIGIILITIELRLEDIVKALNDIRRFLEKKI